VTSDLILSSLVLTDSWPGCVLAACVTQSHGASCQSTHSQCHR